MAETEMVERVARAIKAKVPVGYGMTEDEALEYARAAIEAMREPTDAMRKAMRDADDQSVIHNYGGRLSPDDAYEIAIDAALSPPSKD